MAGERLQHNLGAVQERSKVWSAGRLGSSLAKGRETSSGTQIPRKCWSSTKSKATIFCTASGKVTRASSINLSGNKTSMEWQGTATANKVPSPQGHGNSLAILKHSNRSSFCHKETPSMPLVTSRHSTIFVMHRMTNVRRKKRSCCNTTTQGTTLFVCRGTAFRPTAEMSLLEGLGLASTDYHHTREQQCATGEAVQEESLVTNC